LIDGKVLVAGGYNPGTDQVLSSAELYDPITATFSITGSMTVPRWRHADVRLLNGDVLIVGGASIGGNGGSALASAETYSRK
jgi:hypothetical protein